MMMRLANSLFMTISERNLDLLLALVDPVDEVDHFEREVDDDGVEEEVDRLVDALHVDLPPRQRVMIM